LDVWVEHSIENSSRVFEALKKFGAPLDADNVTPEIFTQQRLTPGVDFADAWRDRVGGLIFGVPVHFISLAQLIANKQATCRSSDLERLEQIRRKGMSK